MIPSVKVFVSYSQDSEAHKKQVKALADQLTVDGIGVILDQYESVFSEGLEMWMERSHDDADSVLLVCTETYRRRVMKEEDGGKGLGAVWEGHHIYQHLYHAGARNEKYVPVLLPNATPACIPEPLGTSFPYYSVDPARMVFGESTGYERLYRRLTGQHETPAPDRGTIRVLPICKGGQSDQGPAKPP